MITNVQRKESESDTDERQANLLRMQNKHHLTCPVCSVLNSNSLQAMFEVCKNGSVEASIVCGKEKEGYPEHLHGGVIASLLDGAMTNCLFAHNVAALTAEMKMRILLPIPGEAKVVVRAWIEKNRAPLYTLCSEIRHDGNILAKAEGKFVNKTYKKKNYDY